MVRTIPCRVQLSNKPCPQISAAFEASLIGVNMVFSLLQRRFVVSYNSSFGWVVVVLGGGGGRLKRTCQLTEVLWPYVPLAIAVFSTMLELWSNLSAAIFCARVAKKVPWTAAKFTEKKIPCKQTSTQTVGRQQGSIGWSNEVKNAFGTISKSFKVRAIKKF